MTIPFLAIDFGATFTRAAFRDSDDVDHLLELSPGSRSMPSAVFADRDAILVGASAVSRATTRPGAFDAHPKLRIAEESLFLGGRDHPTATVVAAVLGHAVAALRQPADHVVISYPDGWGELQRNRMVEAATLAGIDPGATTLITESQAAAVNYTTGSRQDPLSRVCALDVGGRTIDAAVLDLKPSGAYRVTASGSLPWLGGRDLDGRIFAWVIDQLRRRHPDVLRRLDDLDTQLDLMAGIADAKAQLSSASRAQLEIAGTALQLTRSDFESMIQDDVARALDLATRVIDTAQATKAAPIEKVFLSGGSAGIPLIHRAAARLGPLAPLDDPGEAVVRGSLAAIAGSPGKSRPSLSMVYSREDFQIPEPPSKPENRRHQASSAAGHHAVQWPIAGPPPESRPVPHRRPSDPNRPPEQRGYPGQRRPDPQWPQSSRGGQPERRPPASGAVPPTAGPPSAPIAHPAPAPHSASIPHPAPAPHSAPVPPAAANSAAVPLTGAQVIVPGIPADARHGATWGPVEITVPLAASVQAGDVIAVTGIDGLAVELLAPVSGIIRLRGTSGYLYPGAPLVTIAPRTVPGQYLRTLQYLPANARLAGAAPPPSSGYQWH